VERPDFKPLYLTKKKIKEMQSDKVWKLVYNKVASQISEENKRKNLKKLILG
jgi:hypothetical protein